MESYVIKPQKAFSTSDCLWRTAKRDICDKLKGLMGYGLSRKIKVWIINHMEMTICEAQILSLPILYRGSSFNRTMVKCRIQSNGDIIYLYGVDIYFSMEDAKDFLDFENEVNSNIIRKYHPSFKKDIAFTNFYLNFQRDRLFYKQKYESCYLVEPIDDTENYFFRSNVFLTTVYINGEKHDPIFPLNLRSGSEIEDMFKIFLREETEKRQKCRENQELMEALRVRSRQNEHKYKQ